MIYILLFILLAVSIGVNLYVLRTHKKASMGKISSVLLEGIKEINELSTLKQSFQSIVMYENKSSLMGLCLPGTRKKFILKYSGHMVVGTDMADIKITQYISGRIKIAIPKSKIIEIFADMESIKVYDQYQGFFTKLLLDEQNQAISENLIEVKTDAIENGICTKADISAKNILVSLCRGLGVIADIEFIAEQEGTQNQKHAVVIEDVVSLPEKLVDVEESEKNEESVA